MNDRPICHYIGNLHRHWQAIASCVNEAVQKLETEPSRPQSVTLPGQADRRSWPPLPSAKALVLIFPVQQARGHLSDFVGLSHYGWTSAGLVLIQDFLETSLTLPSALLRLIHHKCILGRGDAFVLLRQILGWSSNSWFHVHQGARYSPDLGILIVHSKKRQW